MISTTTTSPFLMLTQPSVQGVSKHQLALEKLAGNQHKSVEVGFKGNEHDTVFWVLLLGYAKYEASCGHMVSVCFRRSFW